MSPRLTRSNLLAEQIIGSNFTINRVSSIAGGFDPPQDDYIHKLWQWRQSCPHANESWHGAFCKRCDTPWRYPTEGGALWIARTDWVENPERAGSDEARGGPNLLTRLQDSGAVMKLSGKLGKVPKLDKTTTRPAETTIMPRFWGQRSPQARTQRAMEPHWDDEHEVEVRTIKALSEACSCQQFWGLTANRSGYELDLPEDDWVKQYENFRSQCPMKSRPGHDAFCQRCDNSFPVFTGEADVLRREDWRTTNPLEKFPESLKPRGDLGAIQKLRENLAPFIP